MLMYMSVYAFWLIPDSPDLPDSPILPDSAKSSPASSDSQESPDAPEPPDLPESPDHKNHKKEIPILIRIPFLNFPQLFSKFLNLTQLSMLNSHSLLRSSLLFCFSLLPAQPT